MPVGLIFEGVGVTQAQYEQARDQVAPGNRPPPGLLYHAAGPTEDGFCVIEAWESQEALQRFFDQHLRQALQDAGIDVPPRFFQIVNVMQP